MSDRDDDLFDAFADAMTEATPAPDPARRADTIAMAMKNFSQETQEAAGDQRHGNRTAEGGRQKIRNGVTWMTRKMKMALAGGTAIATSLAAIVVAVNVTNHGGPGPNGFSRPGAVETSSLAAPEIAREDARVASDVAAPGSPDPAPAQTESLVANTAPTMQKQGVKVAPGAARQAAPQAELAPSQGFMASDATALGGRVATAPEPRDAIVPVQSRDRFEGADINPVKRVAEEPVSTFSIDVDTASWSFARRMIQNWQAPSPDMIRIEEMVNYFDYGYLPPAEDSADPFATHVSTFQAPWDTGKSLVRIGIQGEEPAIEDRPPLDLVFLIDTSGSMRSADKLGLLKSSLAMMISELDPGDRVGIVTYAGSAGTALEMTAASDADEIIAALANLEAGGSTAGAAGLRAAYDMIGASDETGRIGRVVLATDGDFNVGMSSTEEMKTFIEDRRDEGAYLSVLGFGQGNYNDALMQTLAQNGNGQAAYIDTLGEARKVLVDQLSGALYPIADDVKIQVEFNPDMVQEYRLIGYETRGLAREDFNNDKVDAGEIGAGHQVTALYEITMVGSDSAEIPPLRYGADGDGETQSRPDLDEELGFVSLRYKAPGEDESTLIGTPILPQVVAPDTDARFAAAIAGFGQLMKDGRYLGDWSYEDAAALAGSALGEDRFGYREEAVELIELMSRIDG